MTKKTYLMMVAFVLVLSQVGSSGTAAYAHASATPMGRTVVDTVDRTAPVALSLITITAVKAGGSHTCALTAGSGVKCWGENGNGQLGDGTYTHRSMPVDVSGLASGVAALSAGEYHTCALTAGGGAKCWGSNWYGQLGDGTYTHRLTPVDVSGLTSGVAALAAGFAHTCALTAGGGVKCWGDNDRGQLGDGTYTDRLTPVDVSGLASGVAALAAGWDHTCALTAGGGVKCWGWNPFGQLGDGTTINRNMPVDVSGLVSGVAALAAGAGHTCAVMVGGGVKCWGANGAGQLGDGMTTDRLTPVDVSGLTSGVAALAAGWIHTCALTAGGGVKCWGNNSYGQLGDGTYTDRLTPVDVSGLASGMAAVGAGWGHTCALTAGGGAKCWGHNEYGQLGDWTTTTRQTPVDVIFPVSTSYLPTIFQNYCTDFYDDFSNPGSGWFVGENNELRVEYLNGEYRVLVKPAGYLFVFRAPTCDRQDYVVEADARWAGNPGASYGLIFGIVGNFESFYSFEVNTDSQEYALFRYDPGGWVVIAPFTYSPAIQAGTSRNHLKVTRDGYNITLEVNGSFLGTWYESIFAGETGAGLIVSSYDDRPDADARFDNFKITRYGPFMRVTTADRDTTIGPAQPPQDGAFGAAAPKDSYKRLQREEIWP